MAALAEAGKDTEEHSSAPSPRRTVHCCVYCVCMRSSVYKPLVVIRAEELAEVLVREGGDGLRGEDLHRSREMDTQQAVPPASGAHETKTQKQDSVLQRRWAHCAVPVAVTSFFEICIRRCPLPSMRARTTACSNVAVCPHQVKLLLESLVNDTSNSVQRSTPSAMSFSRRVMLAKMKGMARRPPRL